MHSLRLALICLLLGCSLLAPAPAHATTVLPPTFEELVNGSDFIVRTKVLGLRTEATERNGRRWIHTYVRFEVIETIAGTAPTHLELRLLGGKSGDEEMRVEGVPEFRLADEDILFVHGNGRNFFPLYAVMHGRYPIERDASGREMVTRSDAVPLSDIAEIPLPLTEGAARTVLRAAKGQSSGMTPQDFAQAIRTARKEVHDAP